MTEQHFLTGEEAVDLLAWIHDQPQYRHYQLSLEDGPSNSYLVYAAELAGLPITLDKLKDYCRQLMMSDEGRAFPSPQRIYRLCLEHEGILAPSWPEAMLMIRRALAQPEGTEVDLPGPVQRALDAKGGLWSLRRTENEEVSFAQLRDTYAGEAAAHDRLVLAPGGLQAFAEACQFVAATRARETLMVDGRWAAMELGWDPIPGDLAGCRRALAAYEAEFGVQARWGVEARRERPGLRDRTGELRALTAELVESWSNPALPRAARERLASMKERADG